MYFLWNSWINSRQFYASFQNWRQTAHISGGTDNGHLGPVIDGEAGRGRQNQLIREVTRRGAKNTSLSRRDAENCFGPRRNTENIKSVSGIFGVVARPCADRPHFAPADRYRTNVNGPWCISWSTRTKRDIPPDVYMERLGVILSGMDSETEAAHYQYGRHARCLYSERMRKRIRHARRGNGAQRPCPSHAMRSRAVDFRSIRIWAIPCIVFAAPIHGSSPCRPLLFPGPLL